MGLSWFGKVVRFVFAYFGNECLFGRGDSDECVHDDGWGVGG